MSRFLAGASLITLNKIKEGCPPDIKPIAVGETLRRLAGKCACALLIKDKAAEFFHPLQLGVACRSGAENIADGVRRCIEEHWMDEDFVFFFSKLICKISTLSPDRQYWMNVLHFPQSAYHGYLGVVGPTPCYGTHLVRSVLNLECSKVTPWVLCCLH